MTVRTLSRRADDVVLNKDLLIESNICRLTEIGHGKQQWKCYLQRRILTMTSADHDSRMLKRSLNKKLIQIFDKAAYRD